MRSILAGTSLRRLSAMAAGAVMIVVVGTAGEEFLKASAQCHAIVEVIGDKTFPENDIEPWSLESAKITLEVARMAERSYRRDIEAIAATCSESRIYFQILALVAVLSFFLSMMLLLLYIRLKRDRNDERGTSPPAA